MKRSRRFLSMSPSMLSPLPVSESVDLETPAVLRKLTRAHRALAELKGAVSGIPNESILIGTLALQEAKDSSAIENIITTEDDLFQGDQLSGDFPTLAAKEVYRYAVALKIGFERVRTNGFLRMDDILEIQGALVENRAVFASCQKQCCATSKRARWCTNRPSTQKTWNG